MRRSIADSVVVITGASSGIGRATAEAFAERGATVVLAARRDEALDEVAQACERLGGRAIVCPTDMSDRDAVEALARRAVEQCGRIDVWVNNAAVTLFARFEEADYDAFRRVVDTNFFGYVHGARAALPIFREQGEGTLVNVSSVVSQIGQPYTSAYVASKWAIEGFSECLRQELLDAPRIRVCNVLPGTIDTPLFQNAANYTGRGVTAMPPVIPPEKVAAAIVSMAKSPKRKVYVGNAARVLAFLHSIAPNLALRRIAKGVDEEHLEHRPAADSAGNLFEPSDSASVSGGWMYRNRQIRKKQARTLLAIGVLALVGAGVWIGLRELEHRRGLRGRMRRLAHRVGLDGASPLQRAGTAVRETSRRVAGALR